MATRIRSSIPIYLLVRKETLGTHCQYTSVSYTLFPIHTLLVITDEYHLPQRHLIPGQYGQVIPGFYLTRFVDDNGLYRDDLSESAAHEPSR